MKRFLLSAALLLACSGVALAQESEFSGGGGGGVSTAGGSGTANVIPRFVSASSIADSKITMSGTNLGTATLYDSTAVTGVTQLALRAGANQAGGPTPLFRVLANDGSTVLAAISNTGVITGTGAVSGLATGAVPYASAANVLADSPLFRVDANTLAMRNSTTAQHLQVYGTYTDASNYERFGVTYTSAVGAWDIRNDVAGTGTAGNLRFFGFVNADLAFRTTTIGVYYPLTIKADFPPECYIRPGADVMDLGGPSNQFVDFYNGKSYQGGRSKALTDASDIGFVRIANATADTLVAGHINYTISAMDATGHSVEGQSGTVYFAIRNQNGTLTATPDGTGNVADVLKDIGSIGTCTFKSSIATTNCDFIVNADTSLTTTAFTITWTVVITSGNAVVTAL